MMINLDELNENIKKWATERGLDKADPAMQFLKLVEELGELASAIVRDDKELVDDSIGDIHVVLTIMKMQLANNKHVSDSNDKFKMIGQITSDIYDIAYGLAVDASDVAIENINDTVDNLKGMTSLEIVSGTPYESCVLGAYNEIKDRKGKMIDGTFVKESDLSDTKGSAV